jgi:hypothetical protein
MRAKDLQIGQIITTSDGKFYSLVLSALNYNYNKSWFIKLTELTENGLIENHEVYDGDLDNWNILDETTRF